MLTCPHCDHVFETRATTNTRCRRCRRVVTISRSPARARAPVVELRPDGTTGQATTVRDRPETPRRPRPAPLSRPPPSTITTEHSERKPAATSERPGTVPRSSSWWPSPALVVAVAGVGLTIGGVVVIARALRRPEPGERFVWLALGTAVTGTGIGFLVWAVVRLR
jgi:hypothetical protein